MLLLLAALLAGQSPPASQPPVAVHVDQAKQKKPKPVCAMTEVTGSRFRRRVCHDQNGYDDPLAGVSDMLGGKVRTAHESGASGQPMATVPPF